MEIPYGGGHVVIVKPNPTKLLVFFSLLNNIMFFSNVDFYVNENIITKFHVRTSPSLRNVYVANGRAAAASFPARDRTKKGQITLI